MTDIHDNTIIAIPDATAEERKTLGCMVHWRLSGNINADAFDRALTDAGVDPDLLPTRPGDNVYLRRAFEELSERRKLVRPLKGSGWSFVAENADFLDRDDNDGHEAYDVVFSAKLERSPQGSTTIRITPPDHPAAALIREQFDIQRGLYKSSQDLSVWLSQRIIPHYSGISGRDRGGFYYIPAGEDAERFEELCEVLKSVSTYDYRGRLSNGIKMYLTPAIMSDQVVEAMFDSIVDEADKLCDALEDQLTGHNDGTKEVGKRALNTLGSKAEDFAKKLKKYESLLGENLDDFKDRLTMIETGVSMALLQREAKSDAEDVIA